MGWEPSPTPEQEQSGKEGPEEEGKLRAILQPENGFDFPPLLPQTVKKSPGLGFRCESGWGTTVGRH